MSMLRRLGVWGLSCRRGHASSLVVDSPYAAMQYPSMTIPESIWENLDRWPDHTALVCGMTGRRYKYSEVKKLAHNFGTSLADAGFWPGHTISIVLPNLPEFAIAFLGALEAGLTVSPINPIYNAEEIAYQLKDSGSKGVITFPEKRRVVEAAAEKVTKGGLPIVVVGGGTLAGARSFMEMTARESSTLLPKISPDSVAVLPYSSGTTGLPKGVKLTHSNIVTNNTQIKDPNIRLHYDTTENYQDIIPSVLPFFHIYGLVVGMISYLRNGSQLVTLPRFEPESFLKMLKEHKNTVFHVVPPLVQFMASHPAVKPSHLDSVRVLANGAATVSIADAEKLLTKKKDILIVSGYGLTETSPVISSASNTSRNLATVGCPVSDTSIKIVNPETNEILKPTNRGEICCKGPQVMLGYHNNEKATAEAIKDGWLHTGDVGYFDEDGQLYIVDRIKELIKVKGFQVAPLELEEVLKSHPCVADVGVVGKPDTKSGEVPVAFVVIKSGAKQPSTNEIKDFVASKVAEYKKLDSVIFVNSIPKNTTGKILRRDLRETLTKG